MKQGIEPSACATLGNIFNIQRYSIHDGRGIRTLVFLKGCPMRCVWCANPESQLPHNEITIQESRCIKCNKCILNCPTEAVIQTVTDVSIHREKCIVCGRCADVCPANCLQIVGKQYTVMEALEEIRGDMVFYNASGGGVTFSGGEPFCQIKFLHALLQKCKEFDIDTAVETCGHVPFEHMEKCLQFIDTVLFDIKHINNERHKQLTGVENSLLLGNARKIAASGLSLVVRVPVIPGLNDDWTNLADTAAFAKELDVSEIHLLPYHNYGKGKYPRLGKECAPEIQPPTQLYMEELREKLSQSGIMVQLGG